MDNIVIRSFKEIKIENELIETGSEVYKNTNGVGAMPPEIEYDASHLKEEIKDGDDNLGASHS